MLIWLQVLARNFSRNQYSFHTFNYILELIYTRSYLRISPIHLIYYMHFVILFSNTGKNERSDIRSACRKNVGIIDRLDNLSAKRKSVWCKIDSFGLLKVHGNFGASMFRKIIRVKEREKFTKNGERDHVEPISVTRDRCKSLQTARDQAMSLTFHLVMRSSKPIRFVLLIYLAYHFGDIEQKMFNLVFVKIFLDTKTLAILFSIPNYIIILKKK